jgi:hypothetical protein
MFKWQRFVQDNIGKKFGKWTFLKYVGKDRSNRHLIECKCECGKVKQLDHVPFRKGTHSTKCGSCSRVDTCFAVKEFKSIYSHPTKMHATEDDDIIEYYNDFSKRYNRD